MDSRPSGAPTSRATSRLASALEKDMCFWHRSGCTHHNSLSGLWGTLDAKCTPTISAQVR